MEGDPAGGFRPGLSSREAAVRLAAEGPNALPQAGRRTLGRIVGEILREPMFALLLAAAAIYLALGDLREAMVLAAFASTSVVIAVVQEARTERVLDTLRDLTSPRALVIRDGIAQRIAGTEVVRGDLLVLAEGDRVPADAILWSAHDLLCDESLLTGEAVPVRKVAAGGPTGAKRPGGDDLPYVYSGSLVVRGHGQAEVVATGARSEIGKIGLAITRLDPEPPRLQAQMRRLVRNFAAVSLSLSALAAVLYGMWRGGWLDGLLSGVALGMSMLPEEFPLVLTVFMVMGAWRISRARVLTRRIAAIETLGAATVLCTDKTGTLTQNRMSIVALSCGPEIWRRGDPGAVGPRFAELVEYGVLASAREPVDPMEKAFHGLGEEALPAQSRPYLGRTLKWEYGLRPDLLAVTHVWEEPGAKMLTVAAKGAPEAIAELCRMTEPELAKMRRAVDAMAREGMRVLAVARAAISATVARPETPRSFALTFLGLVGIADPLRPNVPAAVRECRTAGIRVVMITGDYPQTAHAIAAAAGFASGEVVTGADLDRLGDSELKELVRSATIFARIMPEQKLRIVNALKTNGEIVAMTGDGVNDAPSLKAAHIGIAMGGRGTDVAREAAALVLLDDDFGSIISAIRLGRRIYDNLRKAMAYILAVHVPIAGLALVPLLFGLPLILWPLHIALLEMVIDPVCSIVFEAEREEADTMCRPPRDPAAPLLPAGFVVWSLLQGVAVLAFVAGLFVLVLRRGLAESDARALAFAALVVVNFGLVLVNRSRGYSLRAALVQPNPALWLVAAATAVILAAILLVPPARDLFRFGPLHADDLAVVFAGGIVLLIMLELGKKRLHPLWASPGRTTRARAR
jgi:Ca2+-transporting ATPase